MSPRLAPAFVLLALASPAIAGGCDAAGPAIDRARPAEVSAPPASGPHAPAANTSAPAPLTGGLPTGLYAGHGGAVVVSTGGPPAALTIIDFRGRVRAPR
jgi:hypothetical protein